MKNQIHEEFKSVNVTFTDNKISNSDKKGIVTFLNSDGVHPKSISTSNSPQMNAQLLSIDKSPSNIHPVNVLIGYTKSKGKKDNYNISLKKLDSNFASAVEKLNKLSKKSKDIVCHSLISMDDVIYVLLLTHKAK